MIYAQKPPKKIRKKVCAPFERKGRRSSRCVMEGRVNEVP